MKPTRAELGRYHLSIDIKASLLCYWQRLEQKSDNPLLHEAFIYARNHSQLLNSDETIQMHYKNEVIKKQQCVKNTRSSIKQLLQKKFSQDWFKAQNDISDSSRQKYTNKEIKKDYRSEEYLKIVRNPVHRISMTKLRLGVHTSGAPNGNFRENIFSEDDLRTRIFGTFAVKFLACLPLLGFSNIYKMV